MEYWKSAKDEHIIYEALTAIADGRVEVFESSAKIFSSSRNKFYTLHFDLNEMSFMSDDNMAYYKDEVSYPMLCVLLYKDIVSYDKESLKYFVNFPWKDVNQKNKNDYMKSVEEFLEDRKEHRNYIENLTKNIFSQLSNIKIKVLGEKGCATKYLLKFKQCSKIVQCKDIKIQ
jgi:hypothetical protein